MYKRSYFHEQIDIERNDYDVDMFDSDLLSKSAGIDAQASQGAQLLVRNEVTQNSPDIQTSGLSASQSAHTPVRRV